MRTHRIMTYRGIVCKTDYSITLGVEQTSHYTEFTLNDNMYCNSVFTSNLKLAQTQVRLQIDKLLNPEFFYYLENETSDKFWRRLINKKKGR